MPIHIMFVVPSLQGGGAERVIVSLLRHLDRTEFRLTLVVVDLTNAVFLDDVPEDVDLINLDRRRVRAAILDILKLIWSRKPNVIFSTLGHLNLAIAMLKIASPRSVHFIARETAMVSRSIHDFRYPVLMRSLYRTFYKKLDLVVCQSEAMRSDVLSTFGVSIEKTTVINNPVDVERVRALSQHPVPWPQAEPGAIRLIAVGRLSKEKGFDLLIKAVALLADVPLQLVILGTGAQDEELKCLVQRLGVAARVYFAGYQTNPYAWIAQADAFVLSSHHEGFPNVVLEALACGLQVVSTPAEGGALEIFARVPSCIVADEVSAPALANALRRWIDVRSSNVSSAGLDRYFLEGIVARYATILRAKG